MREMTDQKNSKGPSEWPDPPDWLEYDEPPPPTEADLCGYDPAWDQRGAESPVSVKRTPSDPGRTHQVPAGKKERGAKYPKPASLNEILEKVFHFEAFRPYQQKVCESVFEGNDLLLVMPTGSGKSLCYQLPGIARGGTTIVVSPLIALMEDQTGSLKEKGLRAERIHSGLSRLQSRRICTEYLDQNLDFLFIAPERLAVPGFPEMLARRKPTLIAIDEAHCISQWGHDFRPDYRLLGERLPILRPAPIIAMTATATPRVQKDITHQLGLIDAQMCIHGFRRTNIAIELVELMPSHRSGKVLEILQKEGSRPAIIYAPTRQKTEALAEELSSELSIAAYHAGLSSETRDKVQASFLSGQIDVIVATIAFGMGIDKPDVRTVIHTALPGSLEGYYQEIGRAGRDGNPSRAVLLHSYGDRRVHQFFHEKTYPEESVLDRIYNRLTENKSHSEALRNRLKMDEEEFDMALEKLWIHGGVLIDSNETVRRGHNKWRAAYRAQRDHRLSQIDEMARFSESSSCRMLYLIQHFGDREDGGRACGLCDFCAPENSIAFVSRKPNDSEKRVISHIISTLKRAGGIGTGRLYSSVCPDSAFPRSDFENLLKSLAKANLIALQEHTFEKDGARIHFRKATLTPAGYGLGPDETDSIDIAAGAVHPPTRRKPRAAVIRRKGAKKIERPKSDAKADSTLAGALKKWRMAMATKRRVPAFRIFTNKVLENLVSELPTSKDELQMISGVGPFFVKNYGKEIIQIIQEHIIG